jgi:hypothetical protein
MAVEMNIHGGLISVAALLITGSVEHFVGLPPNRIPIAFERTEGEKRARVRVRASLLRANTKR